MSGLVGEIKLFAFDFLPENYILCDGRKLGTAQYQNLYMTIGRAFDIDNNDPNTFAIPDLRNRFIRHPDEDGKVGERKGGSEEVVLSVNQMPKHKHDIYIAVDNSNAINEENGSPTPRGNYLNNNTCENKFTSNSSVEESVSFAGITEDTVGISEPLSITNANIKMVYGIRYRHHVEYRPGVPGEIRIWPNSRQGIEEFNPIPEGWRLCNGEAAKSLALDGHLNGMYGRDENGMSKLPDFRGKLATGSNDAEKFGATGGANSIRLNLNQLPKHDHKVKLEVNASEGSTATIETPKDAFINSNAQFFSTSVAKPETLGGIVEEEIGGSEAIPITNLSLGLNYIINDGKVNIDALNEVLVGEILITASSSRLYHLSNSKFSTCDGSLELKYGDAQGLFTLLGDTYGPYVGPDEMYFRLPNLKNRIPRGAATLQEVGTYDGANEIELKPAQLPPHQHGVKLEGVATNEGLQTSIANAILNNNAGPFSNQKTEKSFLGGVLQKELKGEKVDIRNPFLAINYLICTNSYNMPIRF